MKGLGDNLFQRPFVKAAARRHSEVFLETPWPELYEDIPNLRPVRSNTKLRTQAKNERSSAVEWAVPPPIAIRARFVYGSASMQREGLVKTLENCVPLGIGERPALDVPRTLARPLSLFWGSAPYVLVRPATIRREWSNPWRNPRPEYLAAAATAARRAGYRVLVVGDLAPGEEELEGDLPPYDCAMLGGELTVRELFGLVAGAAGLIGGVGWLLPASIALRKHALIVLGGNGAHNAPEKVTDPRLDLARLTWARPDRLCMCEGKLDRQEHQCDKTISDLSTPIELFLTRLPEPVGS